MLTGREQALYFFFFFQPKVLWVSTSSPPHACLWDHPEFLSQGLLVECLNPRWSSEALSSFSLNPCPSFRGSSAQGTLCRTWLSQDPHRTVPGAFPVWKEDRPILADPQRPYKPLMSVCWTALGWIQCQPQLYVSPGTPPQSLYLICSVWAQKPSWMGTSRKKKFPLCKSCFFPICPQVSCLPIPENKRSLGVVVR